MDGITLRKATSNDAARIRKLVIEGRINIFGLDWRRFIVAIDAAGLAVGCVQLKPHRDGTMELASLVVDPSLRGHGIARELIGAVIAIHAGGLYLTCRSELGVFYEKFGFKVLSLDELHGYFRVIVRLIAVFQRVTGREAGLLVMWRDCGEAEVDRYPHLGG
jgi:N-acetylglutamate synthase-like GNAT family acetyltransferase